jgi:hypothetical protein
MYNPRNPRSPRSPLELARASGQDPVLETDPMGVRLAQAPQIEPASADVGPGVIGAGGSNMTDPYGQQLSALQQGLQNLPQQMQQYRDQRGASYEEQKALMQDYASGLQQPERSQWVGRLGAALLAPSKTGSFFESYGNAVNAALDQRSVEDRRRQERDEKLYGARLGLARLTAEQTVNPMDELTQRTAYLKAADEVTGLGADYRLRTEIGSGLTPDSPQGIVEAYRKNPAMFAGPRGQAMVADAQSKLAASAKTSDDRAWEMQKLQEQTRLKMLEDRNRLAMEGSKPTPLDRAEANRVAKRLAEVQTSASEASKLRGDIAALQSARDSSGLESMWFGDTYASLGQMVGAPGASELATVRSQAEAVRLALASQLKGAISDADMRILGLATPGVGMGDEAAKVVLDAQSAAAQRGIERSQFLQRWVQLNGNDYGADEAWSTYTTQNPLFSQSKDGTLKLNEMAVSNWREYVIGPDGQPAGGGSAPQSPAGGAGGAAGAGGAQPQGLLVDPNSLPPNIRAWADKQLQSGVPADQVIERINNHIRNKTGGQQ